MSKIGRPLKFKTEKEFTDFLVTNIDKWVISLLNEEVNSFKVNQTIQKARFGGNRPRIDLQIFTKSGKNIGVEIKNPTQVFHETSRAISQLLAYGVIAEDCGKEFDDLVLITSELHDIAFKIIKKYNLPIRLFYIDREIHGEIK